MAGFKRPGLTLLAEVDPATWSVISTTPIDAGPDFTMALAFNADGSQLFIASSDPEANRAAIYVYNRVPEPTTFLLATLGLAATVIPFRRRVRR